MAGRDPRHLIPLHRPYSDLEQSRESGAPAIKTGPPREIAPNIGAFTDARYSFSGPGNLPSVRTQTGSRNALAMPRIITSPTTRLSLDSFAAVSPFALDGALTAAVG